MLNLRCVMLAVAQLLKTEIVSSGKVKYNLISLFVISYTKIIELVDLFALNLCEVYLENWNYTLAREWGFIFPLCVLVIFILEMDVPFLTLDLSNLWHWLTVG